MPRSIDHLVIAARDLAAAAADYRRLGFTVGSRNRHPWGTENHIVQFDGTFLELIGLGDGFSTLPPHEPAALFANGIARFLAQREGLAAIALKSADAARDARALDVAGLGHGSTMHFGRTSEAADGTRRDVAFTLAFTEATMALVPGFFCCRHDYPENFWAPAKQRHPNGAHRLLGIALAVDEPDRTAETYRRILDTDGGTDASCFELGEGQRLDLLRQADLIAQFGGEARAAAGVMRIETDPTSELRRQFEAAGIPFVSADGRLVVPPDAKTGLAVSFEPRREDSDAAES